ncbi:MAG: 16S rRNA (uracil(1498)-N(3))-methyltransferase [Ardenticatenaceae bacterium]|nr:16S rRNA (uracil(1498)-N(3))-methyltransferase [Ardenticatenaceae bacterium]MCB8990364.1 16S rRNA (uracil(1498)-N(3))-methyltransferase [Ardenticatenaceae bacterium]MCB9005257.1 16S rRNA (uracil(1498)-N(3))-methyltransferase [Ardenticatenaceae bacterium]
MEIRDWRLGIGVISNRQSLISFFVMHRFFVNPQFISETAVTFPPEQAHQIRSVLRMAPGAGVVVLDNAGWEYDVTLTAVTKQQVMGEITARRTAVAEPATHLTLYQAMLKRDNFEWVLQKGTEIGVSRFVPVVTARSVVTTVKPNKLERWQRIITEAAEQSRRGRIPELAAPLPLAEAIAACTTEAKLMPWEEAGDVTIAQALAGRPRSVALFIGPEGGFDVTEVVGGVTAVTLGPRILRAETAAIVAAALTLHTLG